MGHEPKGGNRLIPASRSRVSRQYYSLVELHLSHYMCSSRTALACMESWTFVLGRIGLVLHSIHRNLNLFLCLSCWTRRTWSPGPDPTQPIFELRLCLHCPSHFSNFAL
ncbi:hypothetical protein MPTK1_2g24570 [Marchantia polymorpha subsp. ruderalis]|uniref:Uncharacterized protein n=1 Tax=Marchantia polymorpha TaxID=3197 RepID=A0A2R6VZV5_MARPO|nr:hypothetical protein MARPO_0221s0007 [Marchantia polymorpha]BBN03571.1 hypothetical protein Mp_2g24570 [Marchantia polymorpha subsp. ruderalis]|eukprot:PTQ27112.1 hypothetical protein MARPO_0221s0007 [Marchantia polymorpha]